MTTESPAGEGGATPPPPPAPPAGTTPPTPPSATDDTLGDAGKAALKAEREASKAAKAEAKAANDELARIRAALAGKETDEQTVATAKAEAEAAKVEALRYKVAANVGLPADLIPRMVGDDETSLTEDAKTLLSLVKKAPARKDAGAGNNGTGATELSGNDLLKAALGRPI